MFTNTFCILAQVAELSRVSVQFHTSWGESQILLALFDWLSSAPDMCFTVID